MLNYKHDALLLDKETANDLIEKRKENLIFLDKEKKILNLYSAFVKKSDFVDSDKVAQPLQRTVYVKVNKDIAEIIKHKHQNKTEFKRLLETYTGKRGNCIQAFNRWKNNLVFPFILLRVLSKDQEDLTRLMCGVEYFTDFLNKSRFYPPRTLKELFNYKLIYLVGCSVGDGHIGKSGKRWVLVDGSSKKERLIYSKQFIEKLKILLNDFLIAFETSAHNTKSELKVNNKIFCRFLNFFFSLPYGKKKDSVLRVPLILKYNKTDLEKYFWRGYFDTDGSVGKGVVDFCSSDKNILNECERYLKRRNIKIKRRKQGIVIKVSQLKKI